MELRIATLLEDFPVDRTTLDTSSLSLPPLSRPQRKPIPVEPTDISDVARVKTILRNSRLAGKDVDDINGNKLLIPAKRQQSSAPIAGVLNDEKPGSAAVHSFPSSLPPFSGRLSDLLLDPSQQHAAKRRRVDVDEQTASSAPTRAENLHMKLPQPTQLPKKTPKRPRIPPLLQGLHHPPPLPPKAFPPITGEGGSFGRDVDDRVGLRNVVGLEQVQEMGASDAVTLRAANNGLEANENTTTRGPGKVLTPSPSDKNDDLAGENNHLLKKSVVGKGTKKRNKWSDQETRDLLLGVSRFGIGSWKKILQCADFSFDQRTAVDLKDRFRTCCPGEVMKPKKRMQTRNTADDGLREELTTSSTSSTSDSQNTSSQDIPLAESTSIEIAPKKSRSVNHRKGPAELAQLGIHTPFTKHDRRERCEFTGQDDEHLLRGFELYGPSWHSMRDDQDLGFSKRRPTDLRDRFRIRYPEMFSKAGFKLKARDEIKLKERTKCMRSNDEQTVSSSREVLNIGSIVKPLEAPKMVQIPGIIVASDSGLVATNSPEHALRPHTLRQPLLHSFPGPMEGFTDLASEEDGDDGRSPITLSRNIFEWADANHSQTSMAPPASSYLTAVTSFATDAPFNLVHDTDGSHIDSFATLNLPTSLTTGNIFAATASHSTAGGPSNPYSHINSGSMSNANAPFNVSSGASGSVKQSMNPLLRTPNLPTMIFPQVPASSARSAMHNLPPPADLLSGLDAEARQESLTSGFVFNDTTGFTLQSTINSFDSSATLAPMMGGSASRSLQ